MTFTLCKGEEIRRSGVQIPSGPLTIKTVKISGAKYTKMSFNVTTHQLVCKHSKVDDTEKESLLQKYDITQHDLPKITLHDPAIKHLTAKAGDIIRIERESKTAGKSIYYREAVEE